MGVPEKYLKQKHKDWYREDSVQPFKESQVLNCKAV